MVDMQEGLERVRVRIQVRALIEAGWTAIAIALALSDAGYRSPYADARLRVQTIKGLYRQLGI
jgi:hypothetical protein